MRYINLHFTYLLVHNELSLVANHPYIWK